jgi:hypothetical protein
LMGQDRCCFWFLKWHQKNLKSRQLNFPALKWTSKHSVCGSTLGFKGMYRFARPTLGFR